jgi:hypothetical protein
MKHLIPILLLFLCSQTSQAQLYYETSWKTGGVQYTGLLIYYDDNDATMRVKYKINDKYKVAEFDCYGEHFEEDGLQGYLLDGKNARVVYGNDGNGYSADNFIFVDVDDAYSTPIHIDNNGLEKEDPSDHLVQVDYWTAISTDKFTESYVYGFFDKDEPLYTTLLSYNLQNNQDEQPSTHFRINALGYGGADWAIAMSKGTNYSKQAWKVGEAYPEDWIREKWDEDFYITSMAYGNGEWALAISKGVGYSTQSWKTSSAYPEDWVDAKWEEEYAITALAYGDGEWAVAMSKGAEYTSQTWEISSTYPAAWIGEQWDEDYYITSMAYGNGEWVVVMSEGNGYTTQAWKRSEEYPSDWIRKKWAEDFYVTAVAYGDGEWAVVMSKGTGYSTQAWKTSEQYPKDWVKAKWNGANNSQVNEPEEVEDATLHLILVTNTLINDIGASCDIDRKNTVNEFQNICDALEIPLKKNIIAERDFTKETVSDVLNNLNPKSNDIVVFVYSGHGYRWSNQRSKYPNIDLRYSNYQGISESTAYNLADIYNTIKAKGARLNLVIGDCCNSDVGISNRGGEPSLATRRQSQGTLDKLHTLFLESEGNLIVAAAKPYETACGNSRDGGYFISNFFAALSKETSRLNNTTPKWDNIVGNSIKNASYKTQNLRGCTPQNGIYDSTIK